MQSYIIENTAETLHRKTHTEILKVKNRISREKQELPTKTSVLLTWNLYIYNKLIKTK